MVVIKFPGYKANNYKVWIVAGERMSVALYPVESFVPEALTCTKSHRFFFSCTSFPLKATQRETRLKQILISVPSALNNFNT